MFDLLKKTALFFVLSLIVLACDTQENSDSVELLANTNLEKNEVKSSGGSFSLKITTTDDWKVETDQQWCTLNKTNGTGNVLVICRVEPNTTGQKRTASFVVSSHGKKEVIVVTQLYVDSSQTDPDPIKPDPTPTPTPTPDSATDPVKPSGYAGRIEMPKLKGGADHLFYTHTVNYNGKSCINYSAEYDCTKKHPRWVAFFFDNVNNKKNTSRTDDWGQDPNIPSAYRTYHSDYDSPYNRGHLVASADRYLTREANQQTFYYSNMSPQIIKFNGGIWNQMEEKVRSWAGGLNASDTLYVVKGGQIDGTIADGTLLEYTGNHVAVPRHYFMALLSLRGGQYKAMAFYIDQKGYSSSSIASYAISIDALEQKTGIDFFHNLPNDVEDRVESSYNAGSWF